MSDSPSIDYQAAFTELSTLNKLFDQYHDASLPVLNPSEFEVRCDIGEVQVIIQGLRSGLYYACLRNYYNSKVQYSNFRRVVPEDVVIQSWVFV